MRQYKKVKDKVYSADDNFVKELDELFLAVAVRDDGMEGVVAQVDLSQFPPVEKPLMGATKQDRDAIMKAAEEASKHGIKIKVIRFSRHEVIKEFYPANIN